MLARLFEYRAGLVVAPAGSGKTTLLAQFTASAGVPVAWYRAEGGDANAPAFLHGLGRALSSLGELPPRPVTVEDLAVALDGWPGERAILVVDDLHTLSGTPAEVLLERLVEYAPASLQLLFASRCPPGFNLSRLRVSGQLFEIGADDLRFRSWEVEDLFRDLYDEPLPPEDVAELARRTEGWAAGLQLFHLATRGRPTGERRRMVAELASRSRMVREYLARNVLDHLPDDLRAFLVATSVLGRLTGPLCDELLGRTGSRELLERLEHQQVFTMRIGDDGAYRYHEVLHSHLELALVEQLGEREAKERYRQAGRLLQRAGALPEAIRAYCRAEAWEAVAALAGREGQQLADHQGSWLDALPPGVFAQDPWLVLAKARRYVVLGQLPDALEAYRQAAQAFGSMSAGDICRRESQAVALWLEPGSAVPPGDWLGLLRAATRRNPLDVAREASRLPGGMGRFTEGTSMLLAGRLRDARRLLTAASEASDSPEVLAVVARLFAGLASRASGDPARVSLARLADETEALDIPWLSRVARSMMAQIASCGHPEVSPLPPSRPHQGDAWGTALVALCGGMVRLWNGWPSAALLEEAALGFRRLHAGVAETWARSALALAVAGEERPDSREAALAAIRCARSTGVPGAEAIALLALGVTHGSRGHEHVALAHSIADECGLRLPSPPAGDGTRQEPEAVGRGTPAPPTRLGENTPPLRRHAPEPEGSARCIRLRCFGGFSLHVGSRQIDCKKLKPRPRAVLHLLALHAGKPVHRETLVDALWPEVDLRTGMRNLHVAISTIRGFLEPRASRRAGSMVQREGDAYRLALADDAAVDLWDFETGLAEGRAARVAGDWDRAIDAIGQAMEVYAGDLLPEAGPADWVVTRREAYRVQASEAALALTELHLARGDPATAVTVGEQGLRIDRYRDSQWRVLVTACERAGDRAAAAHVRRGYRQVLDELGLDPAVCGR